MCQYSKCKKQYRTVNTHACTVHSITPSARRSPLACCCSSQSRSTGGLRWPPERRRSKVLLSCEKVALLSGSICQQLSVIILYLWQTTNTVRQDHMEGCAECGNMLFITVPLTALDCSLQASSASHQWKWPLQHLSYASGCRATGL